MALPTAFANLVNPTGPELDSDLSAVGVIGVMPCTISGSANAIIMTPNTNVPIPAANPAAPTIAAYGNYMRFSGVAAATNSGPVTIQVGSLPALPAYKDSFSGPVAFVSGEIVQNCSIEAVYDSTLNSNTGGFHVYCNMAVNNSLIFVSGLIATPNEQTTITNIGGAGSVVVGYTVIPAQSTQDQIPGTGINGGVSAGDALVVRFFNNPPAGVMFMPYPKATNSIALRAANITAASIAAFSVTVGFVGVRIVP
jgi:hypothetical protein